MWSQSFPLLVVGNDSFAVTLGIFVWPIEASNWGCIGKTMLDGQQNGKTRSCATGDSARDVRRGGLVREPFSPVL